MYARLCVCVCLGMSTGRSTHGVLYLWGACICVGSPAFLLASVLVYVQVYVCKCVGAGVGLGIAVGAGAGVGVGIWRRGRCIGPRM
jgi:hypothetical protein